MANFILSNFQDYVYKFGHQLENLIILFVYYNLLRVWQIFFY